MLVRKILFYAQSIHCPRCTEDKDPFFIFFAGDARGRVYAWSVADSSSGCQARLVTQEVNKGSSLEH